MNIFSRMAKDMSEYRMGRIRVLPAMWALVGGQFDRKRCRFDYLRNDADGNPEVLVKRRCVHCELPAMQGRYAKNESPSEKVYYSVPETECRKCKHRGTDHRFRFPQCLHLAEIRKGDPTFVDLLRTATEEVREMIGR